MAITTYSDLKSAITNWMHRGDLTSYLDEFIDMTESKMNRVLRLSEMEQRSTTTTTDEYTELPSDYLEMRNIQINDTYSYPLEYRPPHHLDLLDQNEAGRPKYYTIVNETIQTYPATSGYVMEIDYYKEIPALSDSNTTNFVLTAWPDMYLHGCLHHANIFTKNMEMAGYHAQEFGRLMMEVNNKSKARKFSGAPLQVVSA